MFMDFCPFTISRFRAGHLRSRLERFLVNDEVDLHFRYVYHVAYFVFFYVRDIQVNAHVWGRLFVLSYLFSI